MSWNERAWIEGTQTQYKTGLELIDKCIEARDTDSILDLGCGDGRLTIEIAKLVPNGKVLGIDHNDNLLKAANKNAIESALDNVTIMKLDALEVDFHGEFDVIFSNYVVDLIQDQKDLYSRLYEALKPGGRLVIQALIGPTGEIMKIDGQAMAMVLQQEKYQEIVPRMVAGVYMPKKLRKILEDCGFTEAVIEARDVMQQFSSLPDAYAGAGGRWQFDILPFKRRDDNNPITIPDEWRKDMADEYDAFFTQLTENLPEDQVNALLSVMWSIYSLLARKPGEPSE